MVFRFGNGIFEPLWNRRYVDHVQITVAESIGVEDRGAFYEETGAVRDVLQNHLLQLLSLVAMEPPATFAADALRDEKLKVLRAVAPVHAPRGRARRRPRPVRARAGSAASAVKGYREEKEVDPLSETETFVAARFEIDDWRWSGVPFYLRTGKRLAQRATEIAIQFRDVPHRLFEDAATDPQPNLLAIRVQPDEGILLRFNSKVPGLGLEIRPVTMDFTYGAVVLRRHARRVRDAHPRLDARRPVAVHPGGRGRGRVVDRDADPRAPGWTARRPSSRTTPSGSWGPDEAEELIERDGRRWRRL